MPEAPVRLLHEPFFTLAERAPDREALVWGEVRVTYGALAARAAGLAALLRRLGVGPEVPVGICCRRTPDMVAGMLAALAAGGAYLPLDPKYPRERLRFMLEDAAAPVILADAASAGALPATRAQVLVLEGEPGLPGPSALPAAPEALAYLIYTSGSTGRPKGVAIAHRAAGLLVEWARQVFPPEDLAGVLASTSICFDLSVFEIFVPLSAGGRVILADDALRLAALPAAGEVTLVNTVPSAAAELVRAGGFPPSVRTINLAGEALQRVLVERLYAATAAREVLNLYGPSEDTTYSTWARVPRGAAEPPTIGVPLPGESAWVLDGRGEPVSDGEEGDLHLGGPGLARGYLGRPDLTAERFLPDPFAGAAGARMYRTGDLVRRRPDGELDFLGRIDHQIKIRGFRIELGEIEAALLAHPEVREAVVVARPEETGPRLVAYVAPRAAPVAELRRALAERLPGHMVPSTFVSLAALPLTPNGKVDRGALPAPGRERPLAAPPVSPRTPWEERLAGLWAEALGLEEVGVEDDFFELGGHSLSATRLLWRLREELGVERSLRDLLAAPTVAAFAAAGLAGAAAEGEPPLRKATPGCPLPPDSNLFRLWLVCAQEAGSALYNVPMLCRLAGPLDARVLQRSLDGIAGRHEALRTRFEVVDGRPVPALDSPAVGLAQVNLEALPAPARAAAVRRLVRGAARRPLDLGRGPVLRALLLRLAADRHELLLTIHHIAWDDWSAGVFLEELRQRYAALARGAETHAAPRSAQPDDFVSLHAEMMGRPEGLQQLAGWKAALADPPPFLEIPGDRPRPAVESARGGRCRLDLPDGLSTAVRETARREGLTPYMLLLAAWKAWLARATGSRDLLLAGLAAGRTRPELRDALGFYVNTLFLRTRLAGDPPFRELGAAVRDTVLAAVERQDVPFGRVLSEAPFQRPASRHRMVRLVFTLYREPVRDVELAPGLRFGWEELDTGTAKADLTLFVEERAAGYSLICELSTDLYDRPTVDRMLAGLAALLAGVAGEQGLPVSCLPLLPEGERAQILREWNDTRVPYPRGACVHELFAVQAARSPEAVALEMSRCQLSYAELRAGAERLARRLRGLGVGPEVPVGLLLDRSPELLVSMLAVLEAGGACLPLDLDYPAERLAWMLADSGAPVVVTRGEWRDRLPAGGPATIELDGVRQLPEAGPEAAAPEQRASPENAAMLFYTSGSTGRPKGVVIPHRAVVQLLAGSNFPRFGPDDRVGHLSTISFDAVTLEIWGALLHGGRLVGLDRGTVLAPERLERAIRERGITAMIFPVSLFHHVAAQRPAAFATLRCLMVGGEAPDPRRIREVLAAGAPETLLNCYGPTETTTTVAVQRVGSVPPGAPPVPIGLPLSNASAWVAGRDFALVPAGLPGELWLGGEGLARGYLGRPDLTAERFVPDPFSGEPGSRLYRSGDLVRRLADGTLVFLGRTDHQVKIRGYRVEPGEVEAVLGDHPEVRAAVVLPYEAAPGDRRLAAYVVGRLGRPDPGALRDFLRSRLPEFLVPATLLALDDLPLDANGKLNRGRLPAPEPAAAPPAGEPFRTESERRVAGIWSELLGAEPSGPEASFFDLGGHSLLLARLADRLAEAFGRGVPLISLFEHSSVRAQAAFLDGGGREALAGTDGERVDRLQRGRDRLRERGARRRPA